MIKRNEIEGGRKEAEEEQKETGVEGRGGVPPGRGRFIGGFMV